MKSSNRRKHVRLQTRAEYLATERGCRCRPEWAGSGMTTDAHLGATARRIRRNTASRRDFLFCTYRT